MDSNLTFKLTANPRDSHTFAMQRYVTKETFLSDLIDWILFCLLQDLSENLMTFRGHIYEEIQRILKGSHTFQGIICFLPIRLVSKDSNVTKNAQICNVYNQESDFRHFLNKISTVKLSGLLYLQ